MLEIEDRVDERAAATPAASPLTPSGIFARGYSDATLVVADVVNLGELAAVAGAPEVVRILDSLLEVLDAVARRHGLTPVPVAGVTFAAVSGVPSPRPDHLEAAAEAALEASEAVASLLRQRGGILGLRIGLHVGPVVAALDAGGAVRELYGDVTRVARAMEARGEAGRIQVSEPAARRLDPGYRLGDRRRGDPLTLGVASRFLTGRRAA